jgi:hypothetical protein
MTTTATQCIHGFPTEQCVSCRRCEHGQPTSSCQKCRAAPAARKAIEPAGDRSTHEHSGYEIFYEPAVSGWRFRAPDATTSELSYRSAFLARKAVDARTSGAAVEKPRSTGRKKAGPKP